MAAPRLPLDVRFWRHVRQTDCCWLWDGSLTTGYGHGYLSTTRDGQRQRVMAHHVAWWLTHGSWPVGMMLHSCDVASCVRPDHLRCGTAADNAHDRDSRGRQTRRLRPLPPTCCGHLERHPKFFPRN